MDSNRKREIMIEHVKNPIHKKRIIDVDFITETANNDSCIDTVDLFIKVQNNIVIDAYFDGEACSITTSASSLMMKNIIGKRLDILKLMIKNYNQMLNGKEYQRELLDELVVYEDVGREPRRKKCALLPFEALEKAIKIYENN